MDVGHGGGSVARREPFPLPTPYVFANPHPAAAACRFPAKFSGDPGNCEKRQEGEEGSRAPNGGEKRRSLITPVRFR